MIIRSFTSSNRPIFPTTLFFLATSCMHQAKAQKEVIPTPCDRYLSGSTVSGLLIGSLVINRYSMNELRAGEGCEWGVSGINRDFAMVDFAILRGLKMSFGNLVMLHRGGKPLPNVADHAEQFASTDYNIPGAKETDVMAQKGDMTCHAQLH